LSLKKNQIKKKVRFTKKIVTLEKIDKLIILFKNYLKDKIQK